MLSVEQTCCSTRCSSRSGAEQGSRRFCAGLASRCVTTARRSPGLLDETLQLVAMDTAVRTPLLRPGVLHCPHLRGLARALNHGAWLVRIVRARRRHGGSGGRALLKCGRRSLRRGLFSPLLGRRRLLPMDGFHWQRWSEGDVGLLHDRPDLDLLGHRKRRGWRLRMGFLRSMLSAMRGGIGATRCGVAALRASPGRARRTTPPARPPASAAAAAR